MIHKTRGIVFQFTRFRETSIIVRIFTEAFGLQSYIVNGVRTSKASGNKIALYQPLTLLDLVVYHREHANINRIKEAKCLYPYRTLHSDIKKSSVGIFINEIMLKTVKEESHASDIFDFLFHSLLAFDHQEKGYENFHLIFLLKLSRYLGFGAHDARKITHGDMDDSDEQTLAHLLDADYNSNIPLSNSLRRHLLDALLKFYGEHIETFGEIKSVQILKEVIL